MDVDARPAARPRRLIWGTLTLAVAMIGLALRPLVPAFTPQSVAHAPVVFDIVFGVVSAAGLLALARWLWRHNRRDWRALAVTLGGWAALAIAVTFRLALFARADYDLARLPFLALAALGLIIVAGLLALASHSPQGGPVQQTRDESPLSREKN